VALVCRARRSKCSSACYLVVRAKVGPKENTKNVEQSNNLETAGESSSAACVLLSLKPVISSLLLSCDLNNRTALQPYNHPSVFLITQTPSLDNSSRQQLMTTLMISILHASDSKMKKKTSKKLKDASCTKKGRKVVMTGKYCHCKKEKKWESRLEQHLSE